MYVFVVNTSRLSALLVMKNTVKFYEFDKRAEKDIVLSYPYELIINLWDFVINRLGIIKFRIKKG